MWPLDMWFIKRYIPQNVNPKWYVGIQAGIYGTCVLLYEICAIVINCVTIKNWKKEKKEKIKNRFWACKFSLNEWT